MAPLGLSISRLARDLHVLVNRVSEIVNGRRGIAADTALQILRRLEVRVHLPTRAAAGRS